MAGLIAGQMGAQEEMHPQEPPQEPTQAPPQELPQEPPAGEEEEGDPETFEAAVNEARRVLYTEGGGDTVVSALKSAGDLSDGAASIAYSISQAVDQKVGGVDDDYIVALGAAILGEVCDIAEAAKMPLKPSEAARALRTMALRFVEENGGDTKDLEQAMKAFDETSLDQEEAA